jgi:glycosidase
MKRSSLRHYLPLALALGAVALVSCNHQTPAASSVADSLSSHTATQVKAYMDGLKKTSLSNHLYYHYLRYTNTPASYADWDVWAWPFTQEGYRFDWAGRTTSSDRLSATGDAVVDEFGGAYIDIDLAQTYDGGWHAATRKMGGTPMSYTKSDGSLVATVGFQIVKSASRTSTSSTFWVNDGGDLTLSLADYALTNNDGTTSYHVFVVQDKIQSPLKEPSSVISDPFESDDGKNVTYGDSTYSTANWTNKALASTSPLFLKGDSSKTYLTSGAGIGYQIMVASFADSDGDGFGDIYGIDQKLDYLKDLGVNVLWLTPIQLSDSYHGYDITDYMKVDPKFGSKVSPASTAKKGAVDSDTALADYQELIADANSKGMAVIMDLVLNHTSNGNDWFIKSAQLDPDYRGYYQWGNHETQSAIKEANYWYPYGDHAYSYYAKFGSAMPELNYSYQATRDAVIAMAKYWCGLGVSGFRMDAVKHIFLEDEVATAPGDTIIKDVSTSAGKTLNYSSNLSKNLNFWREINAGVKASYPNAFFVGENFDGHAYHVAPFYEGFDSLFDFYSYFNVTSSVANSYSSSIGKGIQQWDGAIDKPSDVYSASGDTSSDKGLSNSTAAVKYGGQWTLKGIYGANESYRQGGSSSTGGYDFIGGSFTSNHDIARVINRIAGSGSADGISSQGTLTSKTYATYRPGATVAMITEMMLPGCTWIYYGDELGMTGNFQNGATSGTDSYADLSYRQPMKWKQDGVVGDGSFTTGYSITGSGTSVQWDEVNASSVVPSVETASNDAHFQAIRDFAKAKSTIPALIRGSYTAYDWGGNDNIFNIDRTLNGVTYKIVVNLSNSAVNSGNGFSGYTKIASFNGADNISGDIPAHSAILMRE